MVSQVARTAYNVSQSCSSAVAGIWRSVGGWLSSSVLHYRRYSDKGLDGRVPPSPEASSAADLLVPTTLFREFSPAVPKTQTFRVNRSVYDRSAYPPRKWERFRIGVPIAILKPQQIRTVLNEENSPGANCLHASRNMAQEAYYDSPSQGSVCGKELPIGYACGSGNIHMPSASTISQAVAILKRRQQHGITIDSYVFVEVLKLCSNQNNLLATKEVHDCIIQSRMDKHPYVANTLLNVYIKCGRLQDACAVFDGLEEKTVATWNMMIGAYAAGGNIDDARLVFDSMKKRDLITWNRLIGAYAKQGYGREAYRLFLRMKREGFIPNAITYISILNPSASAGAVEWVKDVHGHAHTAGLESHLRVGSALVHMYAKSGNINDARLVFDRMEKRDVIAWNIMIGAYAASGCGVEAYELLLRMKREGFVPDAFTYASILNASASVGALEWVKEVHIDACRADVQSDLRVGNALVQMYAKSGSIRDARLFFDRMENRDLMTWNTMIGAYAERGSGVEAHRLFLQMEREGFVPDAFTYASILNASASAGALEWVKEVHSHALKAGLDSDLRVGNALVHMYAKSGSIDDTRLVFDRMEKRDVITWTSVIGGLAQHGCGREALELFRKMKANGVMPNGFTFAAVLCACSHAGLVDDGRSILLTMKQDYGIEPNIVHYNCTVDLLGRAGHLDEAKALIDNMPVEPDLITWKALLGACRTHCNVELGELAAKEVFKLEPKDPAAYVLLSNIYAATGKWEKVSSVRTIMQERGVRKEPGRSWIEVENKIHEFVAGDISHPEATAIYRMLRELTEKLKAKGYIPDTRLVLHNMDEEDKELALWSHSEKLAIAYGLLRVPRGKAIRVEKNLRICSDCHAATKLISEVTGREIIVRDANRFHHFKNGLCSCGDYW